MLGDLFIFQLKVSQSPSVSRPSTNSGSGVVASESKHVANQLALPQWLKQNTVKKEHDQKTEHNQKKNTIKEEAL
jgi:hypothetical protein